MRVFFASVVLCAAPGCVGVSAPKLPGDPMAWFRPVPTNMAVNLASAPLEKDGGYHQCVQATLYFFAEKDGVPIQPAGDLKFLMYDRVVSTQKPVGEYIIPAAELKDHLGKDLLGNSYVFYLPYEPHSRTTVQVVAHFLPKNGRAIVGGPVNFALKPAAEEVAASKPNANRPANYRQYTLIDSMQKDPNAAMVASQLPATGAMFSTPASRGNPLDSRSPPASPWSQQLAMQGAAAQQQQTANLPNQGMGSSPQQQYGQPQVMQAQAVQPAIPQQNPPPQFRQQPQQYQPQQQQNQQYQQQQNQQYQPMMQYQPPPQNRWQQGNPMQGAQQPSGTVLQQSQFWNSAKQQAAPLQQQQAPRYDQGVQNAGYVGPGPGAAGPYAQ